MAEVSIGIIGIGSMGFSHAKTLFEAGVKGANLKAVCDLSPDNITKAKKAFGEKVQYYSSIDEFFKSSKVDGVIIATPHFSHPELGIKGLKNNMHILVEKPMGVYSKQVKELNNAAAGSGKVFAAMFNQRTRPMYIKARSLITEGLLGDLKRVSWIVTEWYRTNAYYASGGWRATWEGEGGGVLLNQCPHNLDLLQWICGMPTRLRSFCSFGKYHPIEVEDDVLAYFEYPNGATGTFIASTGEYPGSNRLEIVGDKGQIVIEGNDLCFWQNKQSEREWNKNNKEAWASPGTTKTTFHFDGKAPEHKGIIQNWVNAIQGTEKLIAPGQEGISSLQLANAMLLSTWQNEWVDLNFDDETYYQLLQEKIKNSTMNKK